MHNLTVERPEAQKLINVMDKESAFRFPSPPG